MNSTILKIIKEIKQKYISYGLTEKEIMSIIKSYLKNKKNEEQTKKEFLESFQTDVIELLNNYILTQIEQANYIPIISFINSNLKE